MKKERVYSVLSYRNGKEQVLLNNGKDSISSDELLKLLRDGIRTNEIRNGKKIREEKMTKYVFDLKLYDDDKEATVCGKFVIAVNNNEKNFLKNTILSIEDMCKMAVQIRKTNIAKIIAIASTSVIILSLTGPYIARGLIDCIEQSYEYDTRASREAYEKYKASRQPTEEEIKESIEEYYNDLEIRAKNGDKEAMKEYKEYMIEQQIKDLLDSEDKTK